MKGTKMGATEANLTDLTLKEISKGYVPGTLRWTKKTLPKDWAKLLVEEKRINKAATAGDPVSLREALSAYRKLILRLSRGFAEQRG